MGVDAACPASAIEDCAAILPGVTIGEGTVIGAGSVVARDIPAGVVAVGVLEEGLRVCMRWSVRLSR